MMARSLSLLALLLGALLVLAPAHVRADDHDHGDGDDHDHEHDHDHEEHAHELAVFTTDDCSGEEMMHVEEFDECVTANGHHVRLTEDESDHSITVRVFNDATCNGTLLGSALVREGMCQACANCFGNGTQYLMSVEGGASALLASSATVLLAVLGALLL